MKRYVVTNQSSGVGHALCDTLGEAIASAVKLQDEGSRVLIVDSQGSGVIMVGHFDLLEAEGYLGSDLGSEQMDSDLPVAEVMTTAKRTAPKKQIYHWISAVLTCSNWRPQRTSRVDQHDSALMRFRLVVSQHPDVCR